VVSVAFQSDVSDTGNVSKERPAVGVWDDTRFPYHRDSLTAAKSQQCDWLAWKGYTQPYGGADLMVQ
jgi:hypothetical protein